MLRSLSAASMLASPLAIAVSVLAFVAVAARPAAEAPEPRVELEVAGVLPMREGPSAILVLREKGTRTILPLLVAGTDGRELSIRLEGRGPGGLLGETITALGGQVREVEIGAPDATPGGARIRLAQGARELVIDARVAESVVLAVAAGAPIVTSRRVLEEDGLTAEELTAAKDRLGGGRSHRL